jgi:hypothetical protein
MTAHAPAANTAAIVTLTGVAGQRHVITQIDCSYSVATATAASLTVTNCVDQAGAASTYSVALPLVVGTYQFLFPEYLIGVEGASMVVTLEAGGGTTVGKLNVVHAK